MIIYFNILFVRNKISYSQGERSYFKLYILEYPLVIRRCLLSTSWRVSLIFVWIQLMFLHRIFLASEAGHGGEKNLLKREVSFFVLKIDKIFLQLCGNTFF